VGENIDSRTGSPNNRGSRRNGWSAPNVVRRTGDKQGGSMPVYTCTTTESTLRADTKKALAGEIGTIHSAINHVPSTYVNVVFNELPADSVYTDGVPASPFLVNGWVREGHPKAETTRLATEIAAAVTRITSIPAERVLVVFQSSPASFAVEGGRVLPEPGEEKAWIAGN
jgi:phenylpyruvate tautomerase PptA (4-oxalocrotonate tautomerase family)